MREAPAFRWTVGIKVDSLGEPSGSPCAGSTQRSAATVGIKVDSLGEPSGSPCAGSTSVPLDCRNQSRFLRGTGEKKRPVLDGGVKLRSTLCDRTDHAGGVFRALRGRSVRSKAARQDSSRSCHAVMWLHLHWIAGYDFRAVPAALSYYERVNLRHCHRVIMYSLSRV